MTFKDSLSKVKLDLTSIIYLPNGEEHYPSIDFQITPNDFLSYSKEDILVKNDRGIINAISNAKRAIDCQIDSVLSAIGLTHTELSKFKKITEPFINFLNINEDVGFKLKIIHGLNLAPSYIISKARVLRHKLEHNYEKPTIDDAK
jgi:hypothetical protein